MRCIYCGRYISFADLDAGRAFHDLVTPDSELSVERWEAYHQQCKVSDKDTKA